MINIKVTKGERVLNKLRYARKWLTPFKREVSFHYADQAAHQVRGRMSRDTGYAERHTKVVKYRTHRYGVSVPKYTAQLNRGYRPGESKVQQKDLLGWVRRQLGLSGSDMYRAAYLIARKIRDHGTRYRGFIDIKSIHHTVRLKRGIRRSFNRHWRRA